MELCYIDPNTTWYWILNLLSTRYKSNPIWPSWDWLFVWGCNKGHSVILNGRWNFGGYACDCQNTVFMIYPKHYWMPYWLFTMVYARIPHFNLWRGHKHPCSFQLRISLNLKSTRHYVRIDMAPYVKSRTCAQHNCKTWEVVLADCCLFRCISLNIDD